MRPAKILTLIATVAPVAVLCTTIPNTSREEHWRREKPDYAKPGKVDLADSVLGIASLIISVIQSTVKGQQKQRAAYTQSTVQELRNKYPDKNVVVFHNQESTYDFVNGEHYHHEVDLRRSLGTYGFEIWVFDSGTFHLAGDGGHMNWSFAGTFVRESDKDVTFYPIDPPDDPPPGLPFEQLLPPEWPIRRIMGLDDDDTSSRRRGLGPEDGNYLVDCQANDGTISSGIAYYKNLMPGQMIGKKPDDYVDVTVGHHVDWETTSSVHFNTRNVTVTWSILGDSENAQLDESCGVASNGHERFWLYRSPGEFLFEEAGKKCNAMYWGF